MIENYHPITLILEMSLSRSRLSGLGAKVFDNTML